MLVVRSQHTCMAVLARCWPGPPEEQRALRASSSDSSRETSSEGPGGEVSPYSEETRPAPAPAPGQQQAGRETTCQKSSRPPETSLVDAEHVGPAGCP